MTRTLILIFGLITAVIHLAVGWGFENLLTTILFLNGLGYLVLLYAYLKPPAFLAGQRNLVRWVFILYTLVTLVGYFVVWGAEGLQSFLGMITKVDEAALIVALWLDKTE